MTDEQETRLINALAATFGNQGFNSTAVRIAADSKASELSAALDDAIPHHARFRDGYQYGNFRDLAVRPVLQNLASKYFDIDKNGRWHVKPSATPVLVIKEGTYGKSYVIGAARR